MTSLVLRVSKMRGKSLISLVLLLSVLSASVYALASNMVQNDSQDNETADSVWLKGWPYRKAYKITGSTAGTQTNYPMMFIVHYEYGYDIDADVYLNYKCKADFGDIRFADSTGKNMLGYWIQDKVDGARAIVWVKIPYIPASPDNATFYLYYGNLNATTTSNKEWALEFATDFEDGTTQGWIKSWSLCQTSDGVSASSFAGNYSRASGRNYGDGYMGTGDFYEHLTNIVYLTPGSYRIECAARMEIQDGWRTPVEIKLYAGGLTVAQVTNPSTIWRLLSGNFTVGTTGVVQLDVEFHLHVASYWQGGAPAVDETYYIDNVFVHKWCNPEPTHITWGTEQPSGRPLLGDINVDGRVDGQDLSMLGKNYGKTNQ
jgi:hypothetical protein